MREPDGSERDTVRTETAEWLKPFAEAFASRRESAALAYVWGRADAGDDQCDATSALDFADAYRRATYDRAMSGKADGLSLMGAYRQWRASGTIAA
jgi:hypothetical protein